jgi:uncharacterized membrane protein
MRRREDLSTPAGGSRGFGLYYDPEMFGRFSEAIALFLGTARYLVFQTLVISVWIGVNTLFPALRFDEYPYILLTLALSMQASYAAPLILLAQNRQETRDRAEAEQDRAVNARTQADTEFLAREVASIRLALADVVTTDDLAERLDGVTDAIRRLEARIGEPRP